MNVLLVGEEAAGQRILRFLADSGHRVVAVMASPPNGTSASTVWELAQQLQLPTWPAKRVKDPALAEELRAEGVDLILNVHSLFVIRGEVLRAARIGAFNLHPGPLPRYAGLNALGWALYRGESSYGVTVHWMEPGIDTGDIAYQELFPIEPSDTALTLAGKCVRRGIPLLQQLLTAAGTSAVPRIPQRLSEREYFAKNQVPDQGVLHWSREARRVVDFVRAFDYLPFPSPWGHPKTWLDDQEIGILKASLTGAPATAAPGAVGPVETGGIRVACGDEWVLVKSVHAGGRAVAAAEFLRPGQRLTDAPRP
jgi:methionyl-tRNA formyltransferase